MNIVHTFFNVASIFLGLSTVGSVVVHDTNVDKALVTVTSVSEDGASAVVVPGNTPHTHSERGSLHQAIRDLNAGQPRTQPRNQQDKKYVQAKPTARGHHPFDNYTLPIII